LAEPEITSSGGVGDYSTPWSREGLVFMGLLTAIVMVLDRASLEKFRFMV